MKKLYIITLLSVMAGTACAAAPDLTDITHAIEEADIARVKQHWSAIDVSRDLEAKRGALEELIKTTADTATGKKTSIATVRVITNNWLVALGLHVIVCGVAVSPSAYKLYNGPHRNIAVGKIVGVLAGLMSFGMLYGGQRILRSADRVKIGFYATKLKAIADFLEDTRDQLNEEINTSGELKGTNE